MVYASDEAIMNRCSVSCQVGDARPRTQFVITRWVVRLWRMAISFPGQGPSPNEIAALRSQ